MIDQFIITAVLDVGGTFIKHAFFENRIMRSDSVTMTPIDEKSDVKSIMDVLVGCSQGAAQICICMPGPMDYSSGKSFMKHKFQSLYGIELKHELQKRTGASCVFVHDVVAFLAGVIALGEVNHANSPAAVTLGTGLGYAFAKSREIQTNELGSPVHPLWNESYQAGILEDFVSGRGLSKQYASMTGQMLSAKEISFRALDGEKEASKTFEAMGQALGIALKKRTNEDGIDAVILGGQVTRSAKLFLPQIKEAVSIPVTITEHLTDAPLYGAFSMAMK